MIWTIVKTTENWYCGHLYDKNFYIEFLDKIRDEKKFDSKELLIKQIEKDKEVCIELIDTFKEKYEI